MVLRHPLLFALRCVGIEAARGTADDEALFFAAYLKSLSHLVGGLLARVVTPQLLTVVKIKVGVGSPVDGDEEEVAVGTEPCSQDSGVGVSGKVDILPAAGLHVIAVEAVGLSEIEAMTMVVGVFGHYLGLGRKTLGHGVDTVGDGCLGHGRREGPEQEKRYEVMQSQNVNREGTPPGDWPDGRPSGVNVSAYQATA